MKFENLYNEIRNKEILEKVIDERQSDGDSWFLEEGEHSINLQMEDKSISFDSFGDALLSIENIITDDLYNYDLVDEEGRFIFYLNKNEIEYLGLDSNINELLNEQPYFSSAQLDETPPQTIHEFKPLNNISDKKSSLSEIAKKIEAAIMITEVAEEAGLSLKKIVAILILPMNIIH